MNIHTITRAAVIGMGRTGRSVIQFLQAIDVPCEGFDEAVASLPAEMHVTVHTGPLDAALLVQFSHIIVSPGINWQHPALQQARADGVVVYGDLQLFSDYYHGNMMAVTGTNGKTTTVSLIATMLDVLPGGIEAAGNIGRPMLELIDGKDGPPRVVLELSSFQLERAANMHPRWAALLNVQPDHADMHETMESYRAAKLRLFASQTEGDRALLPCMAEWDELAGELAGRGVDVARFGLGASDELACGIEPHDGDWRLFWHQSGHTEVIESADIQVMGMHQHLNLAVSAQAAADYGLSAAVIRQSLTSFRGLPHRLQSLGEVQGHCWYNDSKATNPDAAKAALTSFDRVIWICGGLRKGLDIDVLRDAVAGHVAEILVTGEDTSAYMKLASLAGVAAQAVGSIEQAVATAARNSNGLPVLLSPAAASQDQFRDYAERGRCFADAVQSLGAPA